MKPDGGHFVLLVAAKAVLVEAIIATATIIESTRPFILDSI